MPLLLSQVARCSDGTENLLAKAKVGEAGVDPSSVDVPERVELSGGWGMEVDPVTHRTFYYNEMTDQTQWTSPFE